MNLTKAIRNLERQAAKAEKLAKVEQAKADSLREKLGSIEKLVGILASKTAVKVPKVRRGRKGKMSAAGRARIAAAQKKRWAAFHAKKGEKAVVRKTKRKLSAKGRANIVAALKARWAKLKATK